LNLSIHIPQFEGPLALLLYLIRKEEMDIFDININLITSQYLEYIKKMKEFDLEVAGDFISMAATLIEIKSRMLLPNYNQEGEEEEINQDPRKELVQKLLEYQRFQEASKKLYDRPLLGRDVFRRGKSEAFLSDEEGEIILDEGGLFSLIAYYRNSIRRMKKAIHKVARKTRSIAARILEIKDKLIVGQRVLLNDLITTVEFKKQELLITFLSCLELGKMGLVTVYQSDVYGDIYLTAKREINNDAVGRVEEYDSYGAEDIANNLMAEAEEDQFDSSYDSPQSESDDDQEIETRFTEEDFLAQKHNEPQNMINDDFDLASDDDIEVAERELSLLDNEAELQSISELKPNDGDDGEPS